jgi:two-component system phosphate regulon sensor histidine kinase PhoR
VLSIILLQGIWIKNLYEEKSDQLNKTVYAAMENVASKLEERENLKVLQEQTIVIGKNDDVDFSSSHDRSSVNISRRIAKKSWARSDSFSDKKKIVMKLVSNHDTLVMLKSPENMKAFRDFQISETLARDTSNTDELGKLVNKMLLEVRAINSGEEREDTLRSIIERALQSKGLLMPFEFSLRKILGKKNKMVSQSSGFKESEAYYKADLSVHKVLNSHLFLWLQLNGSSATVFRSMRNSLVLSLLFSILILGSFYYTVRLILRQKKVAEIKNDFVNNMTHELKTPIATISLAIDAMNNPQIKNNEERFSDYSRILKEENQKLNQHVERVLQMSLIEKGQLQLNRTKTNVIEILRSVIKNYALQIEEKNAEIFFRPEREEIIVRADREHLSSVFSNLLDNALKYSSANCRIEISVIERDKELEIMFEDNGIGIEGRQHEKVFEKFYRVQGGNLHDVKGFGLGLSYVKSIVEAHGGSIELQSEPGKGTTFKIILKKDA